MNQDEFLALPSSPASAATPQLSGPGPTGDIGLFESFSRRLGMAREGNYDDAFNFDKTPEAPPPGSETPWWMGGAVTDTAMKVAGLGGGAANALYRKSKGLPTSATQFNIQDIGTLKPAGVVGGMGGGMAPESVDPALIQKQYQENREHRAIYEQAIERYKMGDVQGAEQLLEQYRQMGGVEGAVGAEAAGLMGDPLMMMALPSKLGAVMAPAMVHGGFQAGKQYIQTGQEKGFGSQEAMMQLPGTLVAGGMGAVAGVHAPSHVKNAAAGYKAWKKGRTPEGKAAAAEAAAQQQGVVGEAVGDVQAEMMPVPDDVQARLHTALQGATTLINRGLKKNILKNSADGGEVYRRGDKVPSKYDVDVAEPTEAYEINFDDPMNIEGQQGFKTVPASGPDGPETAGFFPGEKPREIKYQVLDEALIKQLSANSKDPAKTERQLRNSTAITNEREGIVYVGPKGIDRIMRAKDSNSAVQNAVSVITHEGVHALEGGRKKPTKTFDPMTGEDITGTDRAKPTHGGHDRGGEFDSIADDLSGVVKGESLQRLLENDPTWRKAQGLIDADGKISENLHEPGKDVISGTYRESTGKLIEGATGRGLGAGGKKLAKNEFVSEANAERIRNQGKTSPDDLKSAGLDDLAEEARVLAEKVKGVPAKDKPTAIKRILDEYVRVKHISPEHRSKLLQLTRTEVKSPTPNPAAGQADAMIAEAKRLSEQNKVEPAANQAEVDAAHERIAPPPVAKNAPEGTTLRKRTTSEQQTADRETILGRGNRWSPQSTEARLDVLKRAHGMGLGKSETYEALGSTKQEFGRFMNLLLNNKSTRAGALKILNPDANGNVSTQGNVSTREISLNPRVVREAMAAEAEGRDFDASRLPRSSQGNLTPSQVSSTIQDTVRPYAEEAARRLKVGNPKMMLEYAKEIEALLPNLRGFLNKVASSLGSSRARDLYNRDKQLEKLVFRLRRGADEIYAKENATQRRIQEGEKRSRLETELENMKQKEAERIAAKKLRVAAKKQAAEENASGAGAAKAIAKSEPPPGYTQEPSKKPAREKATGGAEETISADMFADPDDFKSAGLDDEKVLPFKKPEEKKRLSAQEALGASRLAAKEARERAVKLLAEQNELKRQQEIVDRRSIAKRNETVGGRTGHSNVKAGEVKRGKDTILKRSLDFLRGKKPVKTLARHGAQEPEYGKTTGQAPNAGQPLPFAEQAGVTHENLSRGAAARGGIRPRPQTPDVADSRVTTQKGTPRVLPSPTAEPRGEKVVRATGERRPGWQWAEEQAGLGKKVPKREQWERAMETEDAAPATTDAIEATGEKLARKRPTSKVSDETLDMARGKAPDKETLLRIRKEKEAREAQEKLDMSTVIESALGRGKEGKATTGWRRFLGQKAESGAPTLTDPQGKPINREGFKKPVKKAFLRRMVADANRADRTSVLARSYEIIAKHAKALAMLEKSEQDAYIDKILRDKTSTQLQRTHAAQLRGREPHQLANLYEDATAAAQALRGTQAQFTTPKGEKETAAARKAFIEEQVKLGSEGLRMAEDELGAGGRLRTFTSNKALQKKYGTTVRNLIEDLLDGREIDPDGEYYIHKDELAAFKKNLAEKAGREFDEENSYNVETTADVIGIRPSLEAKMNRARPLPPQLVPRGGKARSVDKKGNVEPTTYGEADKWLAENEAGEMERRTAAAEKRATPADYESYPSFERLGRQTEPWRETGEMPGPVGKTGQKGTPASLIRRKGQPPSTEIRSNMDKLISTKEKFTVSEADRAIMEILDREAETWVKEQASAPVRIGPGKRAPEAPLPQGMNLKETKVKVRDMIKELAPKGAKGWEEFNRRLLGEGRPRDRATGELMSREGEGLITTLIRRKQLQGGEASVAFREAARKAFKEAQARMETDKQRAARVLGITDKERIAPPPGKSDPSDFKSAGADNMYKAAGDEVRKGIPLSSKHQLATEFAKGMEQVSGGLKSGITGFDISNPARQTALLSSRQIATDPKGFARNVKEMVQSYSEEKYTVLDAKLRARPSYKNAVEAGLRLSMDPRDHDNFRSSDKLGGWISSWKKAAKNPVNKIAANFVEKGILGAQRAYTHYQNSVMLDAFEAGEKWLKDRTTFVAKKGVKGSNGALSTEVPIGRDEVADYIKKGYDVRKKQGHTKQGVKELVDLINTFASRSEVKNETLARVGNVALFSPQMIKSRLKTFQNFGGWMYETPSVRSFGHGAVSSAMVLGGALTTLAYQGAKVAGYNPEIEMDLRSNDFGKLRIGHTTLNPWGDYQQYIRIGAQLLSGQNKLRGSGRVQQADRAAIVARFLRGKLSPLASVATTIFSGADGAGREARSIKGKARAIAESVTPIMGSDTVDILSENPNALGGAMLALAAIGVGVQSSTATRSWIGDYASSQQDVRVTDEIRRLKLEPPRVSSRVSLKGKNAVGQKLYYSLKGDEREEFVNEVMPLISKDIDEFIASKRYQEAPDAVKRRLLFNMIKRENRRYSAAKRLKKDYEGATPVNQWWEE